MKIQKQIKIVKEMKNNRNRGITLISLVVTMIVLMILATVSIDAVMGEKGIINKAQLAKDMAKNSVTSQEEHFNMLLEEYANAMAAPEPEQTEITLEQAKSDNMLTKTENTELKIGDDTVWIPAKFKVHEESADTVDEGIVITDGTNEFVWVPVDDESFNAMFLGSESTTMTLCGSTGTTTNYYSNLRVRSGNSSTYAATTPGTTKITVNSSSISGAREPDLLVGTGTQYDVATSTTYYSQAGYESPTAMAQGFVEDYKNMRASIKEYDGFYIGRYELTGTVESPTVKAGAVLTADSSQAKNWYGLYKACRNVVKDNEKVTSTMIWGCQWDETMNWLTNTKFNGDSTYVDLDSTSWGNYTDVSVKASDGITEIKASGTMKRLETGVTTYTMANKIYDLAGNYSDWTQEAYITVSRVYRGR